MRLKLVQISVLALSLSLAAQMPVAAQSEAAANLQAIEISVPYDKFTLDNGLRVVVHEDRKAPLIAIQVIYEVGSKDEPTGKSGFAHLFEHLMFNGSENLDVDAFIPLRDMGGSGLNGTTDNDRTNYFETVPTNSIEQALFLESDRMGHLLGAVTQEKLDNQIGVVQNEKRIGDDRPFGTRIHYEIHENLYPKGHPYHHSVIGSMKDLSDATLDDVKGWFKQYYGAANAILVLSGDINSAEARPLVQKYFGHIPSGPPLIKTEVNSTPLAGKKFIKMHDLVSFPRIYRTYIGRHARAEDIGLADLTALILGDGKDSRLHKRLVEELQIATAVSVFHEGQLLSGKMSITADAKSEGDIDQINKIIDEEITRFVSEGPTASELKRVKTSYLSQFLRGIEDASGKNFFLSIGELYRDDPGYYLNGYVDQLTTAKPAFVQNTAAQIFDAGYVEVQVLPFPKYKTSASAYDRSKGLPVRGPLPKASFPKISEGTLSNGVKVVAVPRPTIPAVEMSISFDAGDASDASPLSGRNAGLRGLGSATTDMMSRGAGGMTADEIAIREKELGANIAIYNRSDSTVASLSALKANLDESLRLFGDIVQKPQFPESQLAILKGETKARTQQTYADSTAMANMVLASKLFGETNSYGAYDSEVKAIAAIENMTRSDMTGWKDAWIRPDKATIFVTGDVTLDAILPKLDKVFGSWTQPKTPAGMKSISKQTNADRPRVIVIDKKDTQQSVIVAGRLLDGDIKQDYDALIAMNHAFGGNFTSRINMNIREDKGWAYGVYSGVNTFREQQMFTVLAPVQADRTGDSIAELVKEMRAFTSTRPYSAEEKKEIEATAAGTQGARFEKASSILTSMTGNHGLGFPIDFDVTAADRIAELTVEDVRRVARKTVRMDDLTWVIVGDWDKIEAEVRAQNLGPIEVRRAK